MNINMPAHLAEERISNALGFKVGNFQTYHDGFSFTVESSLQAYKSAYKYAGPNNRVVVRPAPNVSAWLVQLYEMEEK